MLYARSRKTGVQMSRFYLTVHSENFKNSGIKWKIISEKTTVFFLQTKIRVEKGNWFSHLRSPFEQFVPNRIAQITPGIFQPTSESVRFMFTKLLVKQQLRCACTQKSWVWIRLLFATLSRTYSRPRNTYWVLIIRSVGDHQHGTEDRELNKAYFCQNHRVFYHDSLSVLFWF